MLDTKIETKDSVCTVHLKGNISLKNAIQLKELIIKLADEGNKEIILDLGDNVYIDSSGIGSLFNSQKYLSDNGGVLKIKNISHEIMTILKIANLDKHLNII